MSARGCGRAGVHRFRYGGFRLAYDVGSGSLHILDRLAWGYLSGKRPPGASDREWRRAKAEVKAAVARGTLLAADPFALTGATARHSGPANPPRGLKALCLHLAHDCNLRCRYCFAGTGAYGAARGLMPAGVARAAIDFLAARSAGETHLSVDFFGGEPLMNWDVLADAVAYAREVGRRAGKAFRFTVTTNATLVDSDRARFLAENMSNIVMSLDGRREVNDGVRTLPGGASTYDATLAGMRLVREAMAAAAARGEPVPDHYARGTYTARNLDFDRDAAHIREAGFASLSLEPVVARGGPLALLPSHLPDIRGAYRRLARDYVRAHATGQGFTYYHFEVDLAGGPCRARATSGCGAGSEYLAVTPEGDIYPCHQFVGRPAYRLGSVARGRNGQDGPGRSGAEAGAGAEAGGGSWSPGAAHIMERFRSADALAKHPCRRCWARYLCGGGCHANADLINGDIMRPYRLGCAIQKARLEAALWTRAALFLQRTQSAGRGTALAGTAGAGGQAAPAGR